MSSGLALIRHLSLQKPPYLILKAEEIGRGEGWGVENVTIKVDKSLKILQQQRNIKVNKQRGGNFWVGKGLYNSSALCGD